MSDGSFLDGMDPILFFCKDCQKVVKNPKKKGAKYAYTCEICGSSKVAFGTKEAVCDFFGIKEAALKRMMEG
jgi:hypothetical protein